MSALRWGALITQRVLSRLVLTSLDRFGLELYVMCHYCALGDVDGGPRSVLIPDKIN